MVVVEVVARRARVSNAREEDIVTMDSSMAIFADENCGLIECDGSIKVQSYVDTDDLNDNVFVSQTSYTRKAIGELKRSRLFDQRKVNGSVHHSVAKQDTLEILGKATAFLFQPLSTSRICKLKPVLTKLHTRRLQT